MPRKDGRRLIYSRKSKNCNDRRTFNKYVWKPHFLDILASQCTKDIEEAKRRVIITPDRKYKYTPSKEYMKFIKKHSWKGKKN